MVGPNLISLDMAMNKTNKEYVLLTICRNGEWVDLEVPVYNMEDNTIKRMVSFGGTLFFEADDIFSDKTGLPVHKVTFANAQSILIMFHFVGLNS